MGEKKSGPISLNIRKPSISADEIAKIIMGAEAGKTTESSETVAVGGTVDVHVVVDASDVLDSRSNYNGLAEAASRNKEISSIYTGLVKGLRDTYGENYKAGTITALYDQFGDLSRVITEVTTEIGEMRTAVTEITGVADAISTNGTKDVDSTELYGRQTAWSRHNPSEAKAVEEVSAAVLEAFNDMRVNRGTWTRSTQTSRDIHRKLDELESGNGYSEEALKSLVKEVETYRAQVEAFNSNINVKKYEKKLAEYEKTIDSIDQDKLDTRQAMRLSDARQAVTNARGLIGNIGGAKGNNSELFDIDEMIKRSMGDASGALKSLRNAPRITELTNEQKALIDNINGWSDMLSGMNTTFKKKPPAKLSKSVEQINSALSAVEHGDFESAAKSFEGAKSTFAQMVAPTTKDGAPKTSGLLSEKTTKVLVDALQQNSNLDGVKEILEKSYRTEKDREDNKTEKNKKEKRKTEETKEQTKAVKDDSTTRKEETKIKKKEVEQKPVEKAIEEATQPKSFRSHRRMTAKEAEKVEGQTSLFGDIGEQTAQNESATAKEVEKANEEIVAAKKEQAAAAKKAADSAKSGEKADADKEVAEADKQIVAAKKQQAEAVKKAAGEEQTQAAPKQGGKNASDAAQKTIDEAKKKALRLALKLSGEIEEANGLVDSQKFMGEFGGLSDAFKGVKDEKTYKKFAKNAVKWKEAIISGSLRTDTGRTGGGSGGGTGGTDLFGGGNGNSSEIQRMPIQDLYKLKAYLNQTGNSELDKMIDKLLVESKGKEGSLAVSWFKDGDLHALEQVVVTFHDIENGVNQTTRGIFKFKKEMESVEKLDEFGEGTGELEQRWTGKSLLDGGPKVIVSSNTASIQREQKKMDNLTGAFWDQMDNVARSPLLKRGEQDRKSSNKLLSQLYNVLGEGKDLQRGEDGRFVRTDFKSKEEYNAANDRLQQLLQSISAINAGINKKFETDSASSMDRNVEKAKSDLESYRNKFKKYGVDLDKLALDESDDIGRAVKSARDAITAYDKGIADPNELVNTYNQMDNAMRQIANGLKVTASEFESTKGVDAVTRKGEATLADIAKTSGTGVLPEVQELQRAVNALKSGDSELPIAQQLDDVKAKTNAAKQALSQFNKDIAALDKYDEQLDKIEKGYSERGLEPSGRIDAIRKDISDIRQTGGSADRKLMMDIVKSDLRTLTASSKADFIGERGGDVTRRAYELLGSNKLDDTTWDQLASKLDAFEANLDSAEALKRLESVVSDAEGAIKKAKEAADKAAKESETAFDKDKKSLGKYSEELDKIEAGYSERGMGANRSVAGIRENIAKAMQEADAGVRQGLMDAISASMKDLGKQSQIDFLSGRKARVDERIAKLNDSDFYNEDQAMKVEAALSTFEQNLGSAEALKRLEQVVSDAEKVVREAETDAKDTSKKAETYADKLDRFDERVGDVEKNYAGRGRGAYGASQIASVREAISGARGITDADERKGKLIDIENRVSLLEQFKERDIIDQRYGEGKMDERIAALKGSEYAGRINLTELETRLNTFKDNLGSLEALKRLEEIVNDSEKIVKEAANDAKKAADESKREQDRADKESMSDIGKDLNDVKRRYESLKKDLPQEYFDLVSQKEFTEADWGNAESRSQNLESMKQSMLALKDLTANAGKSAALEQAQSFMDGLSGDTYARAAEQVDALNTAMQGLRDATGFDAVNQAIATMTLRLNEAKDAAGQVEDISKKLDTFKTELAVKKNQYGRLGVSSDLIGNAEGLIHQIEDAGDVGDNELRARLTDELARVMTNLKQQYRVDVSKAGVDKIGMRSVEALGWAEEVGGDARIGLIPEALERINQAKNAVNANPLSVDDIKQLETECRNAESAMSRLSAQKTSVGGYSNRLGDVRADFLARGMALPGEVSNAEGLIAQYNSATTESVKDALFEQIRNAMAEVNSIVSSINRSNGIVNRTFNADRRTDTALDNARRLLDTMQREAVVGRNGDQIAISDALSGDYANVEQKISDLENASGLNEIQNAIANLNAAVSEARKNVNDFKKDVSDFGRASDNIDALEKGFSNIGDDSAYVRQRIDAVKQMMADWESSTDRGERMTLGSRVQNEIGSLKDLLDEKKYERYIADLNHRRDALAQQANEVIAPSMASDERISFIAQTQGVQELVAALNAMGSATGPKQIEEAMARVREKIASAKNEISTFDKLQNDYEKAISDKNLGRTGTTAQLTAAHQAFINAPTVENARLLNQELENTNQLLEGLNRDDAFQKLGQQIDSTGAKLKEFNNTDKYGKMDKWTDAQRQQYTDAFNAILEARNAYNMHDTGSANAFMMNAQSQMQQLAASFDSAGNSSDKLVNRLKNLFGGLVRLSSPIMMIRTSFNYLRQAASIVESVDTAMVKLKRVTDETASSYERFLKQSATNAKALGTSITGLVTSTAEFAKMGYTFGESKQLAQTATVFGNLAGYSNTDEASSALIAVLNGYELSADQAERVSDRLTKVANTYAVNAQDLTTGLQKSASSLNVAGNDIDQSIAMLTAISEVTRDASSAGSALKTMTMRIRGAKTELTDAGESTDGMAESTSKLREKVAALTNVTGKGGFDIMQDENTFKSTYDIMRGISQVWDQMSDINQSALLELIAGKVRSNQVAALLTNMSRAEEVLATSMGSANSMANEQAIWLDSISAKKTQMQAALQELAVTALSSDSLKGYYDTLKGIIEALTTIVDKGGTVGTVLSTLGAGLVARNGGFTKAFSAIFSTEKLSSQFITQYNNALAQTGSAQQAAAMASANLNRELNNVERAAIASSNGMITAQAGTTGLQTAMKALGTVAKTVGKTLLTFVVLQGAMMAINAIGDAIDKVVNRMKYLREDADVKFKAFEDAKNEADQVNDQLEKIKQQIESINPVTLADKEQLEALKEQSEELEYQLELKQMIAKSAALESYMATTAMLNEIYNPNRGSEALNAAGSMFRTSVRFGLNDAAGLLPDGFLKDLAKGAIDSIVPEGAPTAGGIGALSSFAQNTEDIINVYNTLSALSKEITAISPDDAFEDPEALVSALENSYALVERLISTPEEELKALAKRIATSEQISEQDAMKNLGSVVLVPDQMKALVASVYSKVQQMVTELMMTAEVNPDIDILGDQNVQRLLSSQLSMGRAMWGEKYDYTAFRQLLSTGLFDGVSKQVKNLANSGELTVDAFYGIIEAYPKLNAVMKALGIDADTVTRYYLDQAEAIQTVKEAITSYESIRGKYSAAAERQKSVSGFLDYKTALSEEDYKTLADMGQDYADMVSYKFGTLTFDDEAFWNKYQEEMSSARIEAIEQLGKKEQEYIEVSERLQKAIDEYNEASDEKRTEIESTIKTEADNLNGIQSEIDGYKRLVSQIDSATSAYSKWKAAREGAQYSDGYEEMRTAYSDLETGYKTGAIGSRTYRAAEEFLFGKQGIFGTSEKAREIAKRYLSPWDSEKDKEDTQENDPGKGLRNIQSDMIAAGIMKSSGELNGEWTLDSISKRMTEYLGTSISSEFVKYALIGMNDYIADASKQYNVEMMQQESAGYQEYLKTKDRYDAALRAYGETGSIEELLKLRQAREQMITAASEVGAETPDTTGDEIAGAAEAVTDAATEVVAGMEKLPGAIGEAIVGAIDGGKNGILSSKPGAGVAHITTGEAPKPGEGQGPSGMATSGMPTPSGDGGNIQAVGGRPVPTEGTGNGKIEISKIEAQEVDIDSKQTVGEMPTPSGTTELVTPADLNNLVKQEVERQTVGEAPTPSVGTDKIERETINAPEATINAKQITVGETPVPSATSGDNRVDITDLKSLIPETTKSSVTPGKQPEPIEVDITGKAIESVNPNELLENSGVATIGGQAGEPKVDPNDLVADGGIADIGGQAGEPKVDPNDLVTNDGIADIGGQAVEPKVDPNDLVDNDGTADINGDANNKIDPNDFIEEDKSADITGNAENTISTDDFVPDTTVELTPEVAEQLNPEDFLSGTEVNISATAATKLDPEEFIDEGSGSTESSQGDEADGSTDQTVDWSKYAIPVVDSEEIEGTKDTKGGDLALWLLEQARQAGQGLLEKGKNLDEESIYYPDEKKGSGMTLEEALDSVDNLTVGNVEFKRDGEFVRGAIPSTNLINAGWEMGDIPKGTYSTTYSGSMSFSKDGELIRVIYTPILDNGEQLSPKALDDYLADALNSGSPMEYDKQHHRILLGVTSEPDNPIEYGIANGFDTDFHDWQEKVIGTVSDESKTLLNSIATDASKYVKSVYDDERQDYDYQIDDYDIRRLLGQRGFNDNNVVQRVSEMFPNFKNTFKNPDIAWGMIINAIRENAFNAYDNEQNELNSTVERAQEAISRLEHTMRTNEGSQEQSKEAQSVIDGLKAALLYLPKVNPDQFMDRYPDGSSIPSLSKVMDYMGINKDNVVRIVQEIDPHFNSENVIDAWNELTEMLQNETGIELTLGLDTRPAEAQGKKLEANLNSVKVTYTVGAKADKSIDETVNALTGNKGGASTSIKPEKTAAKGTGEAVPGTYLVDEKGAELIEHVSQGTYELGTDNGARFTKLNKGDVVHTAEDTKKILRRGRTARNGTVKKGGARAASVAQDYGGNNNSKVLNAIAADLDQMVKGGATMTKPNNTTTGNNNKGGNAKKNPIKEALEWAESLVDWIPKVLEIAKKRTADFVKAAEKAVGYLSKNGQLDYALDNIHDEIDYNLLAVERYKKQAEDFATRAGLTADIIELIQEGTIDINEYDEDTRNAIAEYEKWWDKAKACLDTLEELNDQLYEYSIQKLENIEEHFGNIDSYLDAQIDSFTVLVDLKNQYGKEVSRSDYVQSIAMTTEKIQNMQEEAQALSAEMAELINSGVLKVGSDDWYQYATSVTALQKSIADAKISLSELNDEMANVTLGNLETGKNYLEAIRSRLEGLQDLRDAQGVSQSVNSYRMLISNGMKEIQNLQKQNEQYQRQLVGLDVLSEKYQEIHDKIVENDEAILEIKADQEKWNDAIIDMKIEELEKQNQKYQQRLDIMNALDELEKARQRKVSIYRGDGIGFVYESDKDELKQAQENMNDEIYELIKNQLETTKELSNIYDTMGNQLMAVQDTLSQIDFTRYYGSIYGNTDSSWLLSSLLNSINMQDIINKSAGGNIDIDLSGMTLNGVNSVEELGDAIITQLPSYLLQYLYSKDTVRI